MSANNRLFWGRVFGVVSQLASVGLLLTSAWLIVRAAEKPPVMYLMVAIVSVRFFGLARAALQYVERLFTHDAAFAMVGDARVRVYQDVERITPVRGAGSSRLRHGDLVSRVVADVDSLLDRVLRLRGPWVVALWTVSVTCLVLAWLDVASALIVAATSAVSMVAIRALVAPGVRRAGAHTATWNGRLAADMAAAVTASPDLVAYGATGDVLASTSATIDNLRHAQRASAWRSGMAEALVMALTAVAVVAIALACDGLSAVVTGVVVLAPLALLEPLMVLAEAERLRPGIEDAERRLSELADSDASVNDPENPTTLPGTWDLEVDALSVGWDAPVAAPVTFEVPQGQVLGVRGPSGSGKSTLAQTLARLIEPLGGQARLGGVDIREMAADDVRSVIGYMGQDEAVFDTTVRENLRIAAPDASDRQLCEALSSAGLADWALGLRDGLDTMVGEHGQAMSGGERQRLAMARLMLGGHKVWVVDEPTEHLDAAAASSLMDDLLACAPARSIIVISHSAQVLDRMPGVTSLSEVSGQHHKITV